MAALGGFAWALDHGRQDSLRFTHRHGQAMQDTQKEHSTSHWATGLALVLCLVAWLLRMYDSDSPPRDFWTMRQYSSALIARALYYDADPGIPQWKQEAAKGYSRWHAEPPLMEYIASRVFVRTGGERFWPFRAVTATGWIFGGWFLFLILRGWLSAGGALTGLAVYLFLPYGIVSSVAVHADPLMIWGLMMGTWGIVRYCHAPTGRRLLAAGALSGLGLLFKPGPVVFLFGAVFVLGSLAASGWNRNLFWRTATYGLLMILPSVLVNLWAVGNGWYRPGHQLTTYLSPHLLGTFYFWKGWLGRVLQVLTVPGFCLAVLGAATIRRRLVWAVLGGWAVGYFAQSLLCSYTTPTHDYWHMQTIPMAALCLGALADAILAKPAWTPAGRRLGAALGVGFMVLVGTVFWLRDVRQFRRQGSGAEYIQLARQIGTLVGHSANTVLLDYDYGASLKYFAEIDGKVWPESKIMEMDRMFKKDATQAGVPLWHNRDLDAADRYQRFYATNHPDYFIICRMMQEPDRQPGLREFLARHPVVAQSPRHGVWDLKPPAAPD